MISMWRRAGIFIRHAAAALFAMLALLPGASAGVEQSPSVTAPGPAAQAANNPPRWSETRSGIASIPGVERGVLIQGRGQAWRALRPTIATAGSILLAGCVAALAAFFVWRGPIQVSGKPTGRLIERFTLADRWSHWVMGISFVVLALTGLAITYGKYVILPLAGYEANAWIVIVSKTVHNFTGPVFLLSLPFFIARFVRDNLPRRWDLDWLAKGGGMFTGRHVPSGRFNAGEKTLFWGLVCTFSVIQCVTGLVLDFPEFGQGRSAMQSANVIHLVVGLLAISASLFHMYLGTVGVRGAFAAMRHGTVDESWAREHHEIWYDEVRAGKSRQHYATEKPDGAFARVVDA